MKVLVSNVPAFVGKNGYKYSTVWGEYLSTDLLDKSGWHRVGKVIFQETDNTVFIYNCEYPKTTGVVVYNADE